MKLPTITKKQVQIAAAVVIALIAAVWLFWPTKPGNRTMEATLRHEITVEATKQAESRIDRATAEVKKGWANTDEKLKTARAEAYKTVASLDVTELVAGLRSELAIIRDERRNMGDAGRQRSNEPGGRGGNTTGVKSATGRAEHINTGITGRTRRDVAHDNGSRGIQTASTSGEGGVAEAYS